MPDAQGRGEVGIVPIRDAAAVQRERPAFHAHPVPVEIAGLNRIDEGEVVLVAPKRRVIRQPRIQADFERQLRRPANRDVRAELDDRHEGIAGGVSDAVGRGGFDNDGGRLGRVRGGDGNLKLQRGAVGSGVRRGQRIDGGGGSGSVGRSRYGSGGGVERQPAGKRGRGA